MKKRFAVVGLSLAVGITLLATTAFASAQNISGYDAYKEAAKNTIAKKNLTMTVAATVTDNGTNLASASSVLKMNGEGTAAFSGKTVVNSNGKVMSVTNFGKEGQMVTKVDGNDTYFVNNETGKMEHGRADRMGTNTAEEEKVGNMMLDSMVGDLKNNFVTKINGDGSNTISVNLEGNQIPAVVNGVVSLAVKDGGIHEKNNEMNKDEICKMIVGANEMNPNLPKLVSEISIQSASLTAEVTENKTISSQTMNFVVIGKDAAGKAHEMAFSMNLGVSDLGSTTPDTVDLTGKTIKIVEHKDMENR